MSQPTALEQYMLELINRARADAGAQPLAFDADLNKAAELHSRWMIESDVFSHTGAGGSSSNQRMRDAGYSFSGSWASGENIAWASLRAPAGLQDEVDLLFANLMNSTGHRANILNTTFREAGIGIESGEFKGWDAAFATQNFARSGSDAILTGVVYDDADGDAFYDPGEGAAGIVVEATSTTGATYSTETYGSGGYDLTLPPGTYDVVFSGPDLVETTKRVTIGSSNVKLDVSDTSATPPSPSQPPAAEVPTVPAPEQEPSSWSSVRTGTDGRDSLRGTSGPDLIRGEGGNDRLYGGGGSDRLDGGSGNDRISAGSGDDVIIGGSGNDQMKGGSGADIYLFERGFGIDLIVDWEAGIDQLDLRPTGVTFDELRFGRTDADRDGRADDLVVVVGDIGVVGILNAANQPFGSDDLVA